MKEKREQPQQRTYENNDIVNTLKIESKGKNKTRKHSFFSFGIFLILFPIIVLIFNNYFLSAFTNIQRGWVIIIAFGISLLGIIILGKNFMMFIENIKKREYLEFVLAIFFSYMSIVLKNTSDNNIFNFQKSICFNIIIIGLCGVAVFFIIRFCIYLLNEWIKNDFVIKSEKANNMFSTITKVTAVLSALGIWKLVELLLGKK